MVNDESFVTEVDDSGWVLELEAALLTGCDFTALRSISKNRALPETVRPEAWQILLGVANKPDPFVGWDEVFDLPEQAEIRAECAKIVGTIGNNSAESVGVQSDLESVLTLYAKNREVTFSPGNGWTDILQLLLALRLPRAQLYNTFYAITTKYVPRGCSVDGKASDLFRLLLLYHEPQLCSFLDTRRITPDQYASQWFTTLFAHSSDLEVALRMWDVYLQLADPFLIFFQALVILTNAKESILEMKGESPAKIAEAISGFAAHLEADDIEDFCQLAAFYSSRTPQSFRRDYHGPIYGSNLAEEFEAVQVHSLLCLPVSPQELLQAQANKHIDENVHYLVVDSRPMEQYNNGHIPGAFNLDARMQVEKPEDFKLAVDTLGAFKAKTHPNEHLCFMGSGREEEDQYMHMVIAGFLKQGTQYISMARGGYRSMHEVLRESLSTRLKSHNVRQCIVCNHPNQLGALSGMMANGNKATLLGTTIEDGVAKGASFLSRFGDVAKSTATVWKGRMVDIITNASLYEDEQDGSDIRHVSPSNRKGTPYKNSAFMFSINTDSDSDEGSQDESTIERERPHEKVKITTWLKKPDVAAHFPCHEVNDKATAFPSHLLITRTHIIILRESEADDSWGYLRAKRSLATVVKITSKKRYPELLTFRYGQEIEPGRPNITATDRLLIAKAGDAAKAVKKAILELQGGDVSPSPPRGVSPRNTSDNTQA